MNDLELLKKIAVDASKRLKFLFPYSIDEWIKKLSVENYHKHTTWSNLIQMDSATSINEYIRVNEERGGTCYFSGEHGFQGEWIYIYDVCRSTLNKRFRDKSNISNAVNFRYSTEAYWVKDNKVQDNKNCHMVIVARNYHAMRKLNYILSCAHKDGFYYKPRIDLNLLFELTPDDVYITSACIAGWKYDDADKIWLQIWDHFKDSFFLEYQAHNTKPQKDLNKRIFNMSQKFGIQTIIGLDTHYVNEEDKAKRDNLLARKKLHYDDEDGWFMDYPTGKELYNRMKDQGVLSSEEIIYAMMNTHVFINGCEDISLNTDFKIPILLEYQNCDYETRSKILLDFMKQRYDIDEENKDVKKEEGLLYEYGEIKDSGTTDYFLTNKKLIDLGVNKYDGKLTTTSRGSASSYYTSKLLKFTTMDRFESEVPIYPERFITKERIIDSKQMPDIDFNVAKQEPFVLAGKELCGEHGCYPLLAVGKLGEKSGFKLYADIKGIEPSIANEISKSIEQYNEDLKQVEDEEDKKNIRIEEYIKNKSHLKVFNDSKPYQGIIEQAKVHACGFILFNGDPRQKDVIGYGDIRYEIGLIRCVSESTKKSVVVACIEGGLLDAYGYVKDDFLIVDVVGITDKLYKALGRDVPSVSELRSMVNGDKRTWILYEIGATCSLNQCEKPTTTRRVMKYKPQNIKELAAFIAAIRPGFKSLIEGFLNRISYTNGEGAIDTLLEDCFHYMLYQEAVMKIFSWLGIVMKESYDTIKKIGKKKLEGEALAHVEKTLKAHWLNHIGNLDNFEPVYKVIRDSAKYSFNAPHALAMAFDSLYEAWVKAHHTSVFYEITLNHYQDKGDKDKVALLVNEASTIFGYKMGSYQYGKDNSKFVVDDESKIIYPNLASVKGIGEKAVQAMMDIHSSGKDDFIDIYLSIKGTNINATVFRNLVKIGYFSQFGTSKKLSAILDLVDYWKGKNGEGRKTIPKDKINELGLENMDLYKFASDKTKSGNVSNKQFTNVDWVNLTKEMAKSIPDDEYGILELVKFQYQVLGYVDLIDSEIEWRFVLITELDTTYSPKFQAYCLNNGKKKTMKIHKTIPRNDKNALVSFKEIPFEDGEILYIKMAKEQPAQKKVDGKWIKNHDQLEWWIKDYMRVM